MTHHPGSVKPKTIPRNVPPPLWRKLITSGVLIIAAVTAVNSIPALSKIGKIGTVTEQYKPWAYLAAAALIFAGVIALVVHRKRAGRHNGERKPALEKVARLAIATELKLAANFQDYIGVRIYRTRLPRYAPGARLRMRRAVRKVRIILPAGKFSADPSAGLTDRLTPVLGTQLRPDTWDPRTGRLTLVAGLPPEPEAPEPEIIPEAASDPRARAEQIFAPLVGKAEASVTQTDADGTPAEIVVRHKTSLKLGTESAPLLQSRVDEHMPSVGERGWGLEVIPAEDKVRLYRREKMPNFVLHPVIEDYSALNDPDVYGPDPRVLPCATAEGGLVCGWNISRKTMKPHALLTGATGGGKTNAIKTLVIEAARRGVKERDIGIWGLDPKMIELMDLRDFPGVVRLAFKVEHMAQLIEAAYDEMMHRYDLIAEHQAHPKELPALILILDEYMILVSMLTFWWKSLRKEKGPCPHLQKLADMLALSRSASLYILLGVQRPDAMLFNGGARDNLRFRGSLGRLSPQGAMMMWENQTIGTRPNHVRGRGFITDPYGAPVEAQYWMTPSVDRHPMYWNHLTAEERELVKALTPPHYVPDNLTKDRLWLPPSAELPKNDGVEEAMKDVVDVIDFSEVEEGDILKIEDPSGGYSNVVVEQADYDEDSGEVVLDILWEGGSAEQISVEGKQQTWYLGNVNDTAKV